MVIVVFFYLIHCILGSCSFLGSWCYFIVVIWEIRMVIVGFFSFGPLLSLVTVFILGSWCYFFPVVIWKSECVDA